MSQLTVSERVKNYGISTPAQFYLITKYCLRKKAYRTKNVARAKAQKSSIKSGENIVAYKCCYSRHWHIGHALERGQDEIQTN